MNLLNYMNLFIVILNVEIFINIYIYNKYVFRLNLIVYVDIFKKSIIFIY